MNEQSAGGLHRHSLDTGYLPAPTNGRQVAVYNPYTLPDRDSDQLDLRRIWHIIKRYRWLIISVVAVSVITTVILTMMMRPVYRATVLVELKPNSPVLSFESNRGNRRDAREFRNTQANILQSEAVNKRVIQNMQLFNEPEFTGEIKQRGLSAGIRMMKQSVSGLTAAMANTLSLSDAAGGASTGAAAGSTKQAAGLSAPPSIGSGDSAGGAEEQTPESEITPEDRNERAILSRYASRLEVEQVQDSDLLRVSFESFSPKMAADLANRHTQEYIQFIDERRFNSTSSAKAYLEEQIKEAEKGLESSEKTLHAFAREHNIVDVEDRGNVMQSRFEDLSRALTETRRERIMAEVEFRQAQESDVESLPSVLASDIIRNMRQQYADLRAQYQEMSQIYKDNYPKMQQLKSRMEDVKATLEEESVKLVMSLRMRYEQLRDQEEELAQQLEQQRTQLLDLKERAISYNILKREWEANRELYSGLLERQKDFSVASGLEFNDASIVDRAEVPTSKYKPDTVKNASMAGVFGLVSGMGLAFLLAFMDTTFKSREELEQALNIPFLGIVPKLKSRREARDVPTALISAYQPANAVAEAIRSIRTGVLFSRPEHVPKKILVTSTTSGEGKSTIALNFAVILAQSGSRVLIIDADLRKPVIGKWLNARPAYGLSDYLSGKDVDIVNPTSFENLSVIAAGSPAARPTDLLGSLRMRDFLNTVSEQFDFVIVDGPPCLGVADSMLLSTKVDGSLVVVKASSTEKHVVAETVNRLRMVNAPLIGSILNLVDLDTPEYSYYGKYYGYANTRDANREMVRRAESVG